jgi:hypothetical protein
VSPALATQLALQAWPHRLAATAISLISFALFAAILFVGQAPVIRVAAVLVGPVVGGSWAVLCLASWFHPECGSFSSQGWLVGKLPAVVQTAVRWYASLFLSLFLVFCLLVWPVFALSALGTAR